MKKTVVLGAGPAGLAAGYELTRNGEDVVLLEAEDQVGGISKTIEYKGYYFDLGGHRFFSKSERVNKLWREILGDNLIKTPRLSRIYYKNRYFNYPLTLKNALFGMGIPETVGIIFSYFRARLFPRREEKSFEDWVVNRFGRRLYQIFFKTYTEKVWGIPCSEIRADWAAQRIKGLSLRTAVINAVFRPRNNKIKTLINEFYYPLYGPGMMYNEMKKKVELKGGRFLLNSRVSKVYHENNRVKYIEFIDDSGAVRREEGIEFISSIPLTELVTVMNPPAPGEVLAAAGELKYRSLITVDIIVNRKDLFPDNWLYIHSPEVRLGRIQNFKNWSKAMAPDENKTSLGLEYFCTEGDELWTMPDEQLYVMAASETERIKICKTSDIEDYTVVRVPKAYPVYDSGYTRHVGVIKEYLQNFINLQPVGRNGLFKYNNMDHSVLTGLYAAGNILSGYRKYDVWKVNTAEEYHEEHKAAV